MPGLFALTPGTSINLVSERLRVAVPAQPDEDRPAEEHDVPLFDVEQVVIDDSVNITIPAIAELMRRNIPLVLTSHGEKILGLCQPPAPHSIARLAQYRSAGASPLALALASLWVEAKILNSRRVIQRLAQNRETADVAAVLAALQQLAERCRDALSIETLRGYEGTAAGRYFEALGGFFPEGCPFEYRSRQPPHNPANAVLSFAYTILTSEMECLVHAHGLDPAIGFLHEPADRRPSLALDLIEPFRAPVADALALDLLNHGTLKAADHFERQKGGWYLNKTGRKRFFAAYERRMNREFTSDQSGRRTTLRMEMERQVHAVKKALLSGEPFEPFLMN